MAKAEASETRPRAQRKRFLFHAGAARPDSADAANRQNGKR